MFINLLKKNKEITQEGYSKKIYFCGLLFLRKEITIKYTELFLFNIRIFKKNNLISRIETHIKDFFHQKIKVINYKPIDIIIPVYNGYEFLRPLLISIKENTTVEYNLIIIDDASPNKNIIPELKSLKKELSLSLTLISNEVNLGFIKTVNKALALTKNNVALLNSDIVLPDKWAEKLFYPIEVDQKVATVTPFSNAATIFSLPNSNKDNDLYTDIEAINKSIEKLSFDFSKIKLPTGVGFCMAMNKAAIKKIGFFDERFGKGYGEENDWCMRAIENGFYNTIASDLFVWHKHGGSFLSTEKKKLIDNNLKILLKKHPEYSTHVKNITNNLEWCALTFIAKILYCNAAAEKTEVWFDHAWGGGTETYTLNKIEELKNKTLIIRLQNNKTDAFVLTIYYKDIKHSMTFKNFSEIKTLIYNLKIDLIVLNNLAGYKNYLDTIKEIKILKANTKANVSFRAHDFQAMCPNITMTDDTPKYCNCKNLTDCKKCIWAKKKAIITISSIDEWHDVWGDFFENTVNEVIVFDEAIKEIFEKLYPQTKNKIKIIPHKSTPLREVKIPIHKETNIGVLGSINDFKGAKIINKIVEILPKYKDVKIKVIGKIKSKESKYLKILGKYSREDLPSILEKEKIDIIFIPSVWPETFSYTTDEAMLMNVPVACFNLGASATRVKRYNKGLILESFDEENTLETIINFLNKQNNAITRRVK